MTDEGIKERPIIFSGDMVKAILEGRKTQTRRIARERQRGHFGLYKRRNPDGTEEEGFASCPYGKPGDRLWVKERWHIWGIPGEHEFYDYEARCPDADQARWRSPIFMPRAASRLLLEIVSVRVERVQSISEEDVQAEGCTGSPLGKFADRILFPTLWNSINGKKAGCSWESNPWVWVIEFKRVIREFTPHGHSLPTTGTEG